MGAGPSVTSTSPKSSPNADPPQLEKQEPLNESSSSKKATQSSGKNGLPPLVPHMPSVIVNPAPQKSARCSAPPGLEPGTEHSEMIQKENVSLKQEIQTLKQENQSLKQEMKSLLDELKMLRQQRATQVPQDFLVGPPRTVHVPAQFEQLFKKAEAEVAHFFQQKVEDPRSANISIFQEVQLFFDLRMIVRGT